MSTAPARPSHSRVTITPAPRGVEPDSGARDELLALGRFVVDRGA